VCRMNQNPSSMLVEQLSRHGWVLAVLACVVACAAHWRDALRFNKHEDLFIYRAGSVIGLQGRSPYDNAPVRELVVAQYPDDPLFANNLGFFLPPQAIVLFAPFALLPWAVAKYVWAVLTITLTGLAASRFGRVVSWEGEAPVEPGGQRKGFWEAVLGTSHGLARQEPRPPSQTVLAPAFVFVVLLSPIVVTGMIVGQTSALVFACIALGEVAYLAGWKHLAGFLWAIPFIKPHLALPLLPLAWYLGGWRRAAELLLWLVGLNLVGCLVSTGSPLLIRDYLDYLATGHTAVVFNRVETNPHITSWNRLVVAAGGPAIELSTLGVLAGYAVWGATVLVRVRIARSWPTPAWAVAVAFAAAPVCCQVMGYELTLLALVVPHVLDLFAAGRVRTAFLILMGLALAWAPFAVGELLPAHRAIGAAWVAACVLIGGWPRT